MSLDDELDKEAIRLTATVIAGEDWSKEYDKAPKQHAILIRNEAKLQIALTRFFKGLAAEVPRYINWYSYQGQIRADYNVDVVVQSVPSNEWSQAFITVVFNIVENMVAAGVAAGESIYAQPMAGMSTAAFVQQLTLEDVAGMVGKKVLPDGTVVDNPNAAYSVTDTVREDIAQSIKTSMALGETTEEATARVQRVIKNPYRAQRIAQTESVNAYQKGLAEYARKSGARYKQWTTAGAIDICADNAAQGAIPIDQDFLSGDSEPVAHPNCRCGLIYLYSEDEL